MYEAKNNEKNTYYGPCFGLGRVPMVAVQAEGGV